MRVYWKWVVKSVPSLGLGLLMLASTVTPRQATSNVEAWLTYFSVENVHPWLAHKSTDTWVFWISFVGFCGWALHIYGRPNLRNGKMSVMIREGDPWVQVEPGIDQWEADYSRGSLYTYRIALVNSGDSTLRNVEVKLTSLSKKPKDLTAVGSHLKLRHDQVGITNFNIHPTKDSQFMDATFVDVFRYYLGAEGHTLLSITSLPENLNSRIPVDTYDVKIMATSESGEMAIAEVAFIPRPDQIPDFRLVKTQSFPGAISSSR